MEISKVKGTYDAYRMDLSFLELMTLLDALQAGGTGVVADEMRKSISWHLDNELPQPGQPDDAKPSADSTKVDDKPIAQDEPADDDITDIDVLLPAP